MFSQTVGIWAGRAHKVHARGGEDSLEGSEKRGTRFGARAHIDCGSGHCRLQSCAAAPSEHERVVGAHVGGVLDADNGRQRSLRRVAEDAVDKVTRQHERGVDANRMQMLRAASI